MPAIFKSLDELQEEIQEMGNHSPEYWDKQVHVVPPAKSVDRNDFLIKLCTGKVILHVGCTGNLDEALRKVAKKCYGIDRGSSLRPDYHDIDLDKLPSLPALADVEIIVCGEVLEHLSNPGFFLDAVHHTYPTIPLVITVPNAFCEAGAEWLVKRSRENVHKDHVCYYSYTTLSTLLTRAGYEITRHYWYGGKPCVSEGLIALARPAKG